MKETRELGENLIRVVGAVIFNQRLDTVLVGQRAQTASHPGKFEFIGGKVNPGECPEEALRREVAEETGLAIDVGKLLGIAETDLRNFGRPSHQILFYVARILNGVAKLNPAIHQDLRWVRIEELPKLDWIEGNLEFAKKLAVSLTTPVPSRN